MYIKFNNSNTLKYNNKNIYSIAYSALKTNATHLVMGVGEGDLLDGTCSTFKCN